MPNSFKNLIKRGFNLIGFELSNLKSFNRTKEVQINNLAEILKLKIDIDRLLYLFSKSTFANKNQLETLGLFNTSDKLSLSNAQLSQDLFVLNCLFEKRNGFFIEFGATDGKNLSNTYLLEKKYGWNGIVAEPAKMWEKRLKENRNCIVETKCVWSRSGEMMTFIETDNGTLSTLELFADADYHSEKRKNKKTYQVETISLNDLLLVHNAPKDIDYISIDTEGSEFEILNAFDFAKYKVKILTVEHNFTSRRADVFKLLTSIGYRRVFETISSFDDWYVKDFILQPGWLKAKTGNHEEKD